MDQGDVALLIFAAVSVGVLSQGWVEYLEHKQRKQAMDVIKASIEAGREPPAEMYAMLRTSSSEMMKKPPWTEVIVFASLAVGFLLAFALMPSTETGEPRMPFLVIGITMAATSLGCLALALFRRDKR